MGQITLEQLLAAGGVIFGLYEMFTKAKVIHNKPAKEVESKIDGKIDEIKKENEKMQKEINLTLKAVSQLILHEITGDHITDMQSLNQEIQEHLINN